MVPGNARTLYGYGIAQRVQGLQHGLPGLRPIQGAFHQDQACIKKLFVVDRIFFQFRHSKLSMYRRASGKPVEANQTPQRVCFFPGCPDYTRQRRNT
jgi:hypothetical protein